MTSIIQRGLIGLALVGTLATAALAQAPVSTAPPTTPPATTQHRQAGWQQLNLSDDQRHQIRAIMEGYRSQRRADSEAFEQQARLVLNQDQIARWEQIKESHQDGMHRHNGKHEHKAGAGDHPRIGARSRPGGLGHLARQLNLTPEQQAQLQAYREAQGPRERAERQAMASQIRGVLTPAQQTQLDHMRRHRSHQQNPA